MPAVLIAIVALAIIGLPLSLAIERRLSLGTAFLYGSGLVFFILLFVQQCTMVTITIAVLVAMLPGCLVAIRSFRRPGNLATWQPHLIDLVTALTITGYAFFATIAPPWEWDFWVIWGMKARVFLEHGAIDWRFLESPWNAYVHPDYPLLVPLNFDFVGLLNGGWDDRWLGFLSVAWALALLLIVRDLAARESTPTGAALVTLAAATIAINRYVGMAEGPLIAFGGAGVLFIRRALQSGKHADWLHGALLLGLAANVKNEGLALLIAVVIALLVVRAREVWRLWPAVALAAPWLVLRATHRLATDILSTDIDTGSTLRRIVVRLPRTAEIGTFMAQLLYERWFWIVLLVGILVVPAVVRREAFVMLVTAMQLIFYVGSYYATPHNMRWHVLTSWPRLTEQIALPITFVVVLMLWECVALHSVDCQASAASSPTSASS